MSNQTKTDSDKNGVAVRSIGMVGASVVASETCPNCEGGGWMWSYQTRNREGCKRCDGKGRVRTIAPTVRDHRHLPDGAAGAQEDSQ
jgi:DnaJ-class molecular chaperone